MKSQTEGELGKMQFLYPVYLNQENLNINFIKWNCPQHFHFSPLYVKTEKIHPENIIENKNNKILEGEPTPRKSLPLSFRGIKNNEF